jgi:DNA helicase-2/ATP-dependent DNA helicase PcrA
VSFKRIVNVPRRGIGDASVERAEAFARREGVPLLDAARRADDVPGLTAKATKALMTFAGTIDELSAALAKASPSEAVQKVLSETGYLGALEAESSLEALSRAENVREFVTVAQEFESLDEDMDLGGFLERIALITDIDRYDAGEDSVTLMTLHNAKGLEFPVVFLTGMEEGVFPHHRAMTDTEELEEERRLCYVGITRARERVYLTSAMARTMYGQTSFNLASRFLAEVPNELTVSAGTSLGVAEAGSALAGAGQVWRGGAGRAKGRGGWRDTGASQGLGEAPVRKGGKAAPVIGYAVGDSVRHRQFGDGVIVAVKAPDQVTVAFEGGVGTKTLLASYAPLERLAQGA